MSIGYNRYTLQTKTYSTLANPTGSVLPDAKVFLFMWDKSGNDQEGVGRPWARQDKGLLCEEQGQEGQPMKGEATGSNCWRNRLIC